jgi:hypothetical protein
MVSSRLEKRVLPDDPTGYQCIMQETSGARSGMIDRRGVVIDRVFLATRTVFATRLPIVTVFYCLAVCSVLLSPVSAHPGDGRRPSAKQRCGGIPLSGGPLPDVTRHIRASTMGKTSVCGRTSSVECPVVASDASGRLIPRHGKTLARITTDDAAL